uniref:Putative toll/interleukin-1 receptor (TIR) domain-containing protein n=1 Tax=Helianthus annuus TaxID=4232 RepID=A0A251TUI6_HELAN
MASTSASSVQKSFKYDVFLSFRGEDVRRNFVDHLYHALQEKGITTYKDDECIEKGKRINDQLITSIEESRFHIIVFSKNYASSSWCLDELVKIMECQNTKEQTAYPIFYDVEPTEVRNQTGAVKKAFAKHVGGSRSSVLSLDRLCSIVPSASNGFTANLENKDDVGRWRNALKESAGLAGMELKNTFNGHEAKFIRQIVQYISLKLRLINLSIDGKLVGMETRVKNVVSSLEIGSDDVRMIGIKGIGGGGKTTLARAVYDHISFWFEGKSFIENIREVSKGSPSGLKKLQKQLLKDLSNEKNVYLTSGSDEKNLMKKVMRSRKVLVVLDDVDDIDQLEALASELPWFKKGSRIVITTRDEQVLIAQRVNFIHDVNLLSNEEAICLFSRYAFGREIPVQGYEELSGKVVHYAAGLPLTIKVLGSHLCGRSKSEWEDALERLKTIPLKETLEKLELSYNGLENDQKEILLDVVCILKGEMKDEAIRILESCGFSAQIGLRVLEQKSLITISSIDGLRFHDHIEEMAWNIVRHFHPNEPSRHNRLWIKEEIEDMLVNGLGTKATKSIKLKNTDLHPAIIMKVYIPFSHSSLFLNKILQTVIT